MIRNSCIIFLIFFIPLVKISAKVHVVTSTEHELFYILTDTLSVQNLAEDGFYITPSNGTVQYDHEGRFRPACIHWVALPPNKTIHLQSISPKVRKMIDGRFPQSKDTVSINPLIIQHPWIEIGKPREYQGHPLVPIAVYFAREQFNTIQLAEEIDVKLIFLNTNQPVIPEVGIVPTELPEFVLNYHAGKNWRMVSQLPNPILHSVDQFPLGPLYRIKTTQEGITKLTAENLLSVGIQLSSIDVRKIRLLSLGPDSLPVPVSANEPFNWQEIPILVEDGNDNRFDVTDRILFFGRSPSFWRRTGSGEYVHWISPYLKDVTFFLDLNFGGNDGLRMQTLDPADGSMILPNAIGRYYYEPELSIFANNSFIGSGLRWVGPLFTGTMERSFPLLLTGALSTVDVLLTIRLVEMNYGTQPNSFVFSLNQVPFDTLPATLSIRSTIPSNLIREGNNQLTLRKIGNASYYFDWVEATYTRDWVLRDGKLVAFTSIGSRYRVNLISNTIPYVFETSNPYQVRWIKSNTFSDSGSTTINKQYHVADETGISPIASITPVVWGTSDYTDLRASSLQADYIIIYDDAFEQPANRLKQFRETNNRVRVLNVRIADIFDQFSCGNLDPTALRNFLRYAFRYWQRPAPKYVMFLGDGDYDYRGISYPNAPRPIVTYQNGTICTDDFFVRFGNDINPPELVTARLTVQSVSAANQWIDKLIQYETNPVQGLWKNRIILCADDENGEGGQFAMWETTHTMASDTMDYRILPPFFERIKIHLIEYQGIYDPVQVAVVKPEATRRLLTELERGALVVNWIGHGNPRIWAHEQLLRESRDINSIRTGMKLPLWCAFTCDWAYWDDPAQQSFPEKLLEMPQNGAIAIVAATRLTGPESNELLAQNFYQAIFDTAYTPRMSIAEALQFGKLRTLFNRTNSSYYHVLGDPLLRLAAPNKFAWIDTIIPYPIVPLAISNTLGKIGERMLQHDPNGSGLATITIRSSQIQKMYYWNKNRNYPYSYRMPGRLLYRGSGTIQTGTFSIPVLLPLDVSYGDTSGSASIFTESEWGRAAGNLNTIRIAFQSANIIDTLGPKVTLYIDHRKFIDGDFVSNSPLLIADIEDSSGVNLTGDVGHRIIVRLNEKEIDVTDYFSYAPNQTIQGTIEAPLGFLNDGSYTLVLQVFDGANNPSIAKTTFHVRTHSDKLIIRNLLNYPNPIKNNTSFTFECSSSGVGKIHIYTINGTKIYSTDFFPVHIGYNVPQLAFWDGRDQHGKDVANGVYLWRLEIKDEIGRQVESIGRAVVLK